MKKKSIASYAVAGLDQENHELLMQRIAKYCEQHDDVLNLLINGIPVDAKIEDVQAVLDCLNASYDGTDFCNFSVSVENSRIRLCYEYTRTVYYDANDSGWSWYESETHNVPKIRKHSKAIYLDVEEAIGAWGIAVDVI